MEDCYGEEFIAICCEHGETGNCPTLDCEKVVDVGRSRRAAGVGVEELTRVTARQL